MQRIRCKPLQARALHFLIVPFSTTVPSIPTADCQLGHGRGHTVMLQRTQLFGLVKAILLDDLPDESKQMGRNSRFGSSASFDAALCTLRSWSMSNLQHA